jgi:putative colanic acid biosynthesis UDP-glucose lipid carrier transferase
MAVMSLIYLVMGVPVYSKVHFTTFLLAFSVGDILVNYLLFLIVARLRMNGKNLRRALIIGANKTGRVVENYFHSSPDLGYKIVGFLEDGVVEEALTTKIIGPVAHIDEVLKDLSVDEVIITLPARMNEQIQFVVNRADYYGTRVRLVPDYSHIVGKNYTTTSFGELPVINVREISLDRLRLAFMKYVFDVVFSLIVLILVSPICLVLAVLIKLDSAGPVLYCPVRLGQSGRKFKVYKFRSMYLSDPALNAANSTTKGDPRITRIGKIIRKTNLDELPQFLNVLAGDMSVVGPRPHRVFLNEKMQKEVDLYMVRHYLKPGITGWAQVNGWRGPTDTETQRLSRTAHDLWYVENWSPFLDLKIIFLTVFGSKTYKTAF